MLFRQFRSEEWDHHFIIQPKLYYVCASASASSLHILQKGRLCTFFYNSRKFHSICLLYLILILMFPTKIYYEYTHITTFSSQKLHCNALKLHTGTVNHLNMNLHYSCNAFRFTFSPKIAEMCGFTRTHALWYARGEFSL